ncbi:MAG TPA: RNA polymerase sigma factor [Thermoanaerobaculia bacterium]|jgi:RNA polymerase sigma-70 factor (ECF subfamily)|nr:RNA polymerase sigma factor [Thermoanaerobaculia bacterium]
MITSDTLAGPEIRLSSDLQALTDEQVVARVLSGEAELFEILMRRYNQRLYRVARAILFDDAEAEDVMQDAYVRAWSHLEQFAGRSSFATWLTRIAVHEALARARRGRRQVRLEDGTEETMRSLSPAEAGPEQRAIQSDLRNTLEVAMEALPESFRSILMLREIEGLSTAETAVCLDISESLVKTRLHRARAALRHEVESRSRAALSEAFTFHLSRCDRVVAAVLERIRSSQQSAFPPI